MEPTERTYRQGDEPVAGYQLQSFLGRGGFGEVWKAIGPGGVPSAVKIIHDLDRKHGGKELRALRLLRDIRHPNLVPLIAYWLKTKDGEILADDGTLQSSWQQFDTEVLRQSALSGCESRGTLLIPSAAAAVGEQSQPAELVIAMGLAERSLFDRLQECRAAGLPGVPVEELLTYLEDAARAIDLLNSRHEIQHCDVKPQNILLLSGAAQVCDFGLAKMIGEVRETSMGAGTIAYGAPEVLLGKGPTPTTDQYSLAISYFELRTGELPFGSEWISEVLQAKQSGAMNLAQLPAPERNVLARAAALDPSRRFTSCIEMVRALRQATNSSATTTCAEIPSLVDTHSEIRLPAAGFGVRSSSSGASWKWAGMGAIGAALLGSGVMWAVLSEIRPGQAVACPDGGQGSPVGPVLAAPDSTTELDIARELRRADEVLAEADATLAAAKAALAATQLAHQETPNAGNPPAPDTLLPAVQSVAAHAEAIADTSQETAETTREIAASTKDIAFEMEQLRQQLSQAADRGGVISDPKSPADFYHNARTFEERGDLNNARQAYLRLFGFPLEAVDPYARFVSLLRLQEGRAGARESFSELARNSDSLPRRYASILLDPDERRAERWAELVQLHPDFAPAVYQWSREFSLDRLGVQGPADKAQEKKLLEQFLALVDRGLLLRYFLDDAAAAEMVEDAQTRFAALKVLSPQDTQPDPEPRPQVETTERASARPATATTTSAAHNRPHNAAANFKFPDQLPDFRPQDPASLDHAPRLHLGVGF